MPSVFHQAAVNEGTHIGRNSSVFVSDFDQGFIRQKCGGQSLQALRNYKKNLIEIGFRQVNKKADKSPLPHSYTAELVELSQF